MIRYPFIVYEEGLAEIIACGPQRYRLLWDGKLAGTFVCYTWAVKYLDQEFIC